MKYYVYTLAYPDGKVFYVGKGQGDRINQHEKEARSGKNIVNPYKVNVIRKVWAGGEEIIKEKVFETNDEQEAFYMEREYIAYFGRPNLTNLTDGGEGASNPSDETRRKIAQAGMLRWNLPEDRAGHSRADHYWLWLRNWELEVIRRNYPIFSRYSMNKLYPTREEEPEYSKEYGYNEEEIS